MHYQWIPFDAVHTFLKDVLAVDFRLNQIHYIQASFFRLFLRTSASILLELSVSFTVRI